MSDYWIQSVSGRCLDILDPTPDMFSLEEIAHSLSLQCRFVGNCASFYSVAQHCCECARLARERGHSHNTQRWALLHDAHEIVIGDVSRPLKMIPGMKDIIDPIADKLDEAIANCLE